MNPPSALVKAMLDGAQARRAGVAADFRHSIYKADGKHSQPIGTLSVSWLAGWERQGEVAPQRVEADDFQLLFDMSSLNRGLLSRTSATNMERNCAMGTRTAEELEKLRTDYQTNTYDPYVAGLGEGETAEPFDSAFNRHLSELDAATDTTVKAEPVAGAKAAKPKPAAAKPKAGAKPKAAPKPAKEPKPKGFRPSSEDRKVLNAAADKAKGKAEGAARLVPQGKGQTYTDFLQGKVLKLDANGNGSTTLNVVTAKAKDAPVGTVVVTVKAGVMSAKKG